MFLTRTFQIPPNNILLISIKDTKYPINVEVMHKVCSIIGTVVKIVIFERTGRMQAMVEFDTLENASKARSSLHGADIYSNCCTMKAEYSKMESLRVRENGVMSWDFSSALSSRSERRTILNDPEMGDGEGFSSSFMGGGGGGNRRGMLGTGGGMMRGTNNFGGVRGGFMGENMMEGGFEQRYNETSWGSEGGGWEGSTSCVVIVNNLPEKFNCDRLFNIVCLYGNVSKIFFMKKKDGSAMVEMGDPEAAQRVVTNLNKVDVLGKTFMMDLSR